MIIGKILSQRRKSLHTLKNMKKIILHRKEITYGPCQCRLWAFQREIKFCIFLEKKMWRPTYEKTKLRLDSRCSLKRNTIINLVLIQRTWYLSPWIGNVVT